MFKAILFDLDDTLIDFFNLKIISCNAAVKAMIDSGLPMKEKQAMIEIFELYKEHGIEDREILGRFLQKHHELDYKMLTKGIHAYRETQRKNFKPYEGVKQTLKKLKEKKLKLGIVSDAPNFKLWLRLVEAGMEELFDVVVGFNDSKEKKPNSMPFKIALKKLGMKPEQVIYVGDWPERDIVGAKKAGIKTVLATYRVTHPFDDTDKSGKDFEPDFKIKKFEEILKIV